MLYFKMKTPAIFVFLCNIPLPILVCTSNIQKHFLIKEQKVSTVLKNVNVVINNV